MVEMDATYVGKLRCSIKHGPSGNVITTDAPKDNQGEGASFSPTDLVAAALGACTLTIIGIYAARHQIEIVGATAHVEKEMIVSPQRRIGKVTVRIQLPKSVPPEHREPLERAGNSCPVHASLHPETIKDVQYVYA